MIDALHICTKVSFLLDRSPEEVTSLGTIDGKDDYDLFSERIAAPKKEVAYGGGIYICKPLTGTSFV